MAKIRVGQMTIPKVQQEITVDGAVDHRIWCEQVDISAGLGGTTASFSIPDMLFDEAREKYKDRKVVVKAALGSGIKETIFVGYLTGDGSELSDSDDSCSLSAYSVGHFLTHVAVGIDMNHWQYEYSMRDPRTGLLTGYTPLYVLTDLMSRLPDEWKDEVALGDVSILADTRDVSITSFVFSLQDYRSAIEMVASAFGDVTIKERFAGNKTYLDFYKVSSPQNPLSTCKVARWDEDPDANVGRLSPAKTGDQIINHVQVFGRNQAFVVTLRSQVAGLGFSEQDVMKALRKDWDPALEPLVLKTPGMASSDRIQYSVVAKENAGNASTFKCDLTFDPVINKTILIHTKTDERMLVTGYTPKIDADPEADPPVEAVDATVTVTRMYQAPVGQQQANIKAKDALAIEIPGISKVFKSYRLPEIFKAFPRKHILQTLPILDDKREPLDTQIFLYKSTLNANAVPDSPSPEQEAEAQRKLTGVISSTPMLFPGCRVDFENHKIELKSPAVQAIAKEKENNGKIKTTYAETCVGVTLCYIDDLYCFAWDTGTVDSDTELPWGRQTARQQLEEHQHNNFTNINYPLVDWLGNEHVFPALVINQKTGEFITTPTTLRYDIEPLKSAAERILSERNRRHISYSIHLDWYDPSYQVGNRMALSGVADYIKDSYTINQISFSMPVDGDHTTGIVIDNTKPPARSKFKARLN